MDMSFLYAQLVNDFSSKGIKFSKVSNGFSIEYREDCENIVVKILLDFYRFTGYNVLLLNQNGKYSICIESQINDDFTLLERIRNSMSSYVNTTNYVSFMEQDVKTVLSLFKKSFRYPGNFGIGVKNLAEVYG